MPADLPKTRSVLDWRWTAGGAVGISAFWALLDAAANSVVRRALAVPADPAGWLAWISGDARQQAWIRASLAAQGSAYLLAMLAGGLAIGLVGGHARRNDAGMAAAVAPILALLRAAGALLLRHELVPAALLEGIWSTCLLVIPAGPLGWAAAMLGAWLRRG